MMDQSYQDCLTILKTMREEFDWEIEEERVNFLRRLDPLIRCWQGQLPNFRDIFRPEEIDWLLSESTKDVTCRDDETPGERFISFVARSGYKNEPDVGEDGKPLLRRSTPIHDAFGYRHVIHELFKIYDRFDANYIDESGFTHFHVVCMSGCYDIVEKFLEFGQDPNCIWPIFGDSPLHCAITYKDEEMVALLLRNGADPNLANKNGMTPLHAICRWYDSDNSYMRIAKTFFKICNDINQPVQVDARDQSDNTPLHMALYRKSKFIAEILLRNGANPNLANAEGLPSLHMILQYYLLDDDLVEVFFEICNDVQQTIMVDVRDTWGRTPLHMALSHDRKKAAEALLRRGANPNLTDEYGTTALHFICAKGDDYDDLGEILFKISDEKHQPVQVDAQDNFGNTPLHVAFSRKCKNLMKLLLRHDANPNSANKNGCTPLNIICDSTHDVHDFVEIFFNICNDIGQRVQVDVQNNFGLTPLYYALSHGQRNLAHLLLKNGANLNLVNADGSTLLHIICQCYNDVLVKTLFEISNDKYPVQVDARNKSGNTPLHLALSWSFKIKAEILLRNGANPNLANTEGLTPVHIICIGGNVDLADLFFKINDEIQQTVSVDTPDQFGNTPLHLTLKNGHYKMIELLLKRGANLNLTNAEGSTTLHIICRREYGDNLLDSFFKIIDKVNQTVQLDAKDKFNRTPLQWAIVRFLPNDITALLDRGAEFVFPTEDHFDEGFEVLGIERYDFKIERAIGVLPVIEILEKKGYELDLSGALIIMNLFAKNGLLEKSVEPEEFFRIDSYSAIHAKSKKIMIHSNLSFYDLIQLRFEEAAKLIKYNDYLKFASSEEHWMLLNESRCRCITYLCEILLRGFFQRWALNSFMGLTRYRLPILCCEMIIKKLKNEDLRRICLAAEDQSA